MFFLRKDSIINNFKKFQPKTYKNCLASVHKSKYRNNIYYLNKSSFIKSIEKSFDYAILEKTKNINAINFYQKVGFTNFKYLKVYLVYLIY